MTAGSSAPTMVSSMVRQKENSQTPGALGAMYDHAFDVAGRRGSRHEEAIGARGEIYPLISLMHGGNDRGRIEQHHEMLREDAQRVHDQFALRQPDSAGLRHTERT